MDDNVTQIKDPEEEIRLAFKRIFTGEIKDFSERHPDNLAYVDYWLKLINPPDELLSKKAGIEIGTNFEESKEKFLNKGFSCYWAKNEERYHGFFNGFSALFNLEAIAKDDFFRIRSSFKDIYEKALESTKKKDRIYPSLVEEYRQDPLIIEDDDKLFERLQHFYPKAEDLSGSMVGFIHDDFSFCAHIASAYMAHTVFSIFFEFG